MTYQQIYPILEEFRLVVNEMNAIRKDIQQYRLQFKSRLDVLQKQYEKCSQQICDFLNQEECPGIQYKEYEIVCERKKVYKRKKDHLDELQKILARHDIQKDSLLAKEICQEIQHREKDMTNRPLIAKMKPLS